ncbi:MAG: hypothetical protein NT133_01125 [Alphaproteobacteria bacterium]|nr:hypothetical protein [Alphaproteobacteria bacterium]
MVRKQPYTGELHPDSDPAAIGMPLAQAFAELAAPDLIAERDAANAALAALRPRPKAGWFEGGGRDGLDAVQAYDQQTAPVRRRAEMARRAVVHSVYDQLRRGELRAIGRPETGANPLRWIRPHEWDAREGVPADPLAVKLSGTVYRQVHVVREAEDWQPQPEAEEPQQQPVAPRMPPPHGWDLMEAAEALFPEQQKMCWESEQAAKLFVLLSASLLRAIVQRSDLQFAGTFRGALHDGKRVKISRDHYVSGDFFDLDIMSGKLWIGAPGSQRAELVAVRVVSAGEPSAGGDGAAIAPPVGQAAPVADASRVVSDERGKPAKPDRAGVAPPVTKSKRGRQPSPMKANAQEFAMRWLEENGAPQRGDGSQAVLERDILALAGRRGEHELGASTVRNWVREWIDEFSADRASGQKFE